MKWSNHLIMSQRASIRWYQHIYVSIQVYQYSMGPQMMRIKLKIIGNSGGHCHCDKLSCGVSLCEEYKWCLIIPGYLSYHRFGQIFLKRNSWLVYCYCFNENCCKVEFSEYCAINDRWFLLILPPFFLLCRQMHNLKNLETNIETWSFLLGLRQIILITSFIHQSVSYNSKPYCRDIIKSRVCSI